MSPLISSYKLWLDITLSANLATLTSASSPQGSTYNPSFTLTQAREGRNNARMVSVRATVPLLGALPTIDLITMGAMAVIIALMCILVFRSSRHARHQTDSGLSSLERERNELSERIAARTKELITAETERMHELNRTAQLGKLSRGLFHDLMSPLASISMYMDKLGSTTHESAEARDVVQKVVTISHRMNAYMESVRRCIGNAPELSKEIRADLAQELPIIEDVLGYKARMAGVTLKVQPCKNVYLPIHPIRAHQLLANLCTNAIEACEQSLDARKDLVVSVEVLHTDHGATIHVRDNGCGMAEDQLQNLFHKQLTTKSKGLGIGLKTVKSIVDELEGTIDIRSSKSSGTTISILIPPHKITS
jgi:C4-dicarboxylate-specific signal transduction histidine kinase